ncbi:MAG TPA: hypothetical protein VKK79_04605 [Candidatus Lokiarchaeia archaeon]|nr:hypothetical protein [Candidatus Lokiarchaeia archaeon]
MPKLPSPPEKPLKPRFVADPRSDNVSGDEVAMEEITNLRAELQKKDEMLNEMQATFDRLKNSLDQIEPQLAAKEEQMATMQMQVELKESQFAAIQSTVQSKDNQIGILKESMELKDQNIQALSDSLAVKDQQLQNKEDQLTQIKVSTVSSEEVDALQVQLQEKQQILDEKNALLEELTKEHSDLKREAELLKQDLEASDALTEKLQKQLDEGAGAAAAGPDLEKVRFTREQIIKKTLEILNRGLHNVTIIVPSLEDLENLNLYEVKSSVSVKVGCFVDPTNPKHNDLLQEIESLDNISIRLYENKDRWAISKDNEELFLAAVGEEENLVFYTRDPLHIKMLNPLVMESWLRARKI